MSVFRKIVFYLLALIYLIFCPLIILYAFGFIVRPGDGRGIVKTGLIYLSTVPVGAEVYLGQSRFAQKTPAVIRDLLPGDYPVTLVSQGHRVWTETIPVEAEKASVLEKVLLLPDQIKMTSIAAGPFRSLIPVEGTEFLLLGKGKKARDLSVYDWKKNILRPLFFKGYSFLDDRLAAVYSVRGSSKILLGLGENGERQYIWLDLSRPALPAEDLTRLFGPKPQAVKWDPNNENTLYSFQNGALDQLNIRSQSLRPRFIEGVAGFDVYKGDLFILKEDYSFARFNDDGKSEQVLLKDAEVGKSLFGGKGDFNLEVLTGQLIVFLSDKGEFMLNRLPYQFVPAGAMGFQYYKKPEKLLVWLKDKVGVLDLSEERMQDDTVFETAPRVVWNYEKGAGIAQAFWVYEGSHILFRDGPGVYLLDEETYGRPRLHHLMDVQPAGSVFYTEESGKLYFIKPGTGAFCSTEILPKREVVSLPFPERKEKTIKRKSDHYGISLLAPFVRPAREKTTAPV